MPYKWTVDVEYDFGGRTNGQRGIAEGLPRIIGIFKEHGIIALFFVSTELLEDHPSLIESLWDKGHQVGSHGHFHTSFKESFRRQKDKDLSAKLIGIESPFYRAPKFGYITDDIYSDPKGHASLLKHMWTGQKIKPETIIYLHPFDIVETPETPPNLFCRLWYSRPKKAYKLFHEMVNKYK